MEEMRGSIGPLDGVRVLDIGTMLGLGHAGAMLSDFGAEVIKVEQPRVGDSLREMGPHYQGQSIRWLVIGRNKKSITINLRVPEGQQIVRELVERCDVVMENFRPGIIDKWGLGYRQLCEVNPRIILLSLSGYGQTGPSRHKPGFGRVLEAVSGLMNCTGEPEGAPMQMGVPLTDYITGTFAAMAVSMALRYRDVHPQGEGQWIDLTLYETMFRLLDALVLRYDKMGIVPHRSGNRAPNQTVPSDVFRTRDGRYIFHSSATQTVFERLAKALGREDLLQDPNFATNADRIQRADETNDLVQAWFEQHDFQEAIRIMEEHDVPVGPVNTMAEVMSDPQLLSRDSIVSLDHDEVGPLKMPGLVPKFSKTPGEVKSLGPKMGQHNEEILGGWLGYSPERLAELRETGVI